MSGVPIDLHAVRVAKELSRKLPMVATCLKHIALLGTGNPARVAWRICSEDGAPIAMEELVMIANGVGSLTTAEWRELERVLHAVSDRLPDADTRVVSADGT